MTMTEISHQFSIFSSHNY